MAFAQIVDISECINALGLTGSITDADLGLLNQLRPAVETDVRRFCRHNITQPSSDYVHILPSRRYIGDQLQLPQMFVRSITELREDDDASAGQDSDDFDSDSILTEGDDYFLDLDESGLSKTGIVFRRNQNWPVRPRTVKVTYNAGLTASELDGDYADLKFAVVEEICHRFQVRKSRQGSDGVVGPIRSESIGGEYSVTYAQDQMGESGVLTQSTENRLTTGGYVHMGILM